MIVVNHAVAEGQLVSVTLWLGTILDILLSRVEIPGVA